MVKQYETVFIMNPVLSEDQVKDTVKKFKKILTSNGAEVVFEDNWGLRKLSYPIQKKNTGFYYLFEFKGNGEFINKMETEFKRDERIMRYLTVALDKHAIAYNERKRKQATAAKEAEGKSEGKPKREKKEEVNA